MSGVFMLTGLQRMAGLILGQPNPPYVPPNVVVACQGLPPYICTLPDSYFSPELTYTVQSFPGTGYTLAGGVPCLGRFFNSYTFNFPSILAGQQFNGYAVGLYPNGVGGFTPYYAEGLASPYTVPSVGGALTVSPTMEWMNCLPPFVPGWWVQEGLGQSLGVMLGVPYIPPPSSPINFAFLTTANIPFPGACIDGLSTLVPDYTNAQAMFTYSPGDWVNSGYVGEPCWQVWTSTATFVFPSGLAGTTYYGIVLTPFGVPLNNYAIWAVQFAVPYTVPPGGGTLAVNIQLTFRNA